MIKKLVIKKKYLYTIFSVVAFKIIIEFGYFTFVNPYFGYSGFIIDISLLKMLESYLFVIVLSYLLASLDRFNRPSKIVIYILYVNLFLPLSSLYWLRDESRPFFMVVSICFLLLYFILNRKTLVRIPTLKEGKYVAIAILVSVTLIVYGYIIATGGLLRINLNLLDVYDTREGYSGSTIRLMGYLLPWQAHVINFTFLIYGLIKKNKIVVFFSLFLQVFLFSMTNFKSFLFAPIVVIGIYLIIKKGYQNRLLLLMTSTLSLLILFLLTVFKLTNNILFLSIFLRRLFFVPASLHYTYFNFFEHMEKYKLSASIFSSVIDNPYNISPVGLVAREVYGKDFSPNVGIFGDGYLNFGFVGMILFIVILGFVLVFFDSVSKKSPLILSMSIIIIPSMALVNSGMFTSFLTHGILFSIFVTWLTSTLFKKYEMDKF